MSGHFKQGRYIIPDRYKSKYIGDYNNITYDGEKYKVHGSFPELIFNERAAVVYNMGANKFAGLSFNMNNLVLGHGHNRSYQSKWLSRVFFGIRL